MELCISADLLQPDHNDNGVGPVFESLRRWEWLLESHPSRWDLIWEIPGNRRWKIMPVVESSIFINARVGKVFAAVERVERLAEFFQG